VQSYLGQPGLAAYAATKGGLVSMARSIAADLAPRKIRVGTKGNEGERRGQPEVIRSPNRRR